MTEVNSNNKFLTDSMTKNLTDVISGTTLKVYNNISSPSIAVSPDNDTIYLSFSKTQNNQTNTYLTNSTDGGKSFSTPLRVNNVIGDATENP